MARSLKNGGPSYGLALLTLNYFRRARSSEKSCFVATGALIIATSECGPEDLAERKCPPARRSDPFGRHLVAWLGFCEAQ
jgi:hypothetical protein